MSTLAEQLRAAKALIDTPDKWIKGHFWNSQQPEARTKFCAIGACEHMCPQRGVDLSLPKCDLPPCTCAELKFALARHIKTGYYESVIDFNDDEATKHEDVMALYDRAIKEAEERAL